MKKRYKLKIYVCNLYIVQLLLFGTILTKNMKILKAIGNFFVKIWRWIKNTAWVQPLLIVGAIFGIIFSIPAITNGIQGLINSNNSADKFYRNYQKSLSGGINSVADRLFDNYEKKDNDHNYVLPKEEMKYFVMFTASNNSTAGEIKQGFQTLKDSWTSFGHIDSNYPFRLYTIYTDEVTTDTTKTESAFTQFYGRKNWFLIQAQSVGEQSMYCLNGGITKSDLEKLSDPSNFMIPTIILVDWTGNEKISGKDNLGITQVMFNCPGANSYERASLLADCWNNRGKFKNSNA